MNLAQNRSFSSFIYRFYSPDTRTKTAQKRTKNVLHTRYTWAMLHSENRRIPPDTQYYDNVQKTLDFWDFLIYYSVRYSGIVQSVEQRTVNPYVAGSSPAARATNSVAKSLILRRFSLLTLLDLGTPQSTQKHHYLTPWLHSRYTGSATYPQSDE